MIPAVGFSQRSVNALKNLQRTQQVGEAVMKPVSAVDGVSAGANAANTAGTVIYSSNAVGNVAEGAGSTAALMEKGAEAAKNAKIANGLSKTASVINNPLVKGVAKVATPIGMVADGYTGITEMNAAAEAGDQAGVVSGAVRGTPIVGGAYGSYRDTYKASSELADARAERDEAAGRAKDAELRFTERQQANRRANAADSNSGVTGAESRCELSEADSKDLQNPGKFPTPATNYGTACIQHGEHAHKIFVDDLKPAKGLLGLCQKGSQLLNSSSEPLKRIDSNQAQQAKSLVDESFRMQKEAKQNFQSCIQESEKQIKELKARLYGRDKMSFDNIAIKSIEYRRQIQQDMQAEKARSGGQRTPALANLESRYEKYMIDTRGLVRQTEEGKAGIQRGAEGSSICLDNAIYVQKIQNELKRLQSACENQAHASDRLMTMAPDMKKPYDAIGSGPGGQMGSGSSREPVVASNPTPASARETVPAPKESGANSEAAALDRLSSGEREFAATVQRERPGR
jgi:hypothetical protein